MVNNELIGEIELITEKVKKFVAENSHASKNSVQNIEISKWRPIILKAECTADLELKYIQGIVDKNSYSRAKQDYQNKYQSYLIAHNQYVQAMNQFEVISNREKDLEWHKKTRLSYPIKPSEPVEPNESKFVIWNEKNTKENYTAVLNEKFLLSQEDSRCKYLEYINPKIQERTTHGNFLHKSMIGTTINYDEILIESFPDERISESDGLNIEKDINKELEKKFYTISNEYMQQWYFKNLSVDSINYKTKILKINFSNMYVGTYKYSGKSYQIAIDLTNNLINGELPSNIKQIGIFIVSHCSVIFTSFILNLLLFYFYWEGYFATIVGYMLLTYLGFMLIVYSNFFEKLNTFKIMNSGFSKRIISMNLNSY